MRNMRKLFYAAMIAVLLGIVSEEAAVQLEPAVVMAAKATKKTGTKTAKQSNKKKKKKTKTKKQKNQSSQQQAVNPDAGCVDNPDDILTF